MADEEDFQFIYNNFPPDPPEIERHGKVTCDLTRFDAPPQFPFSVCSHHDLQVLKLFVDNFRYIPKELGNLVNLEHLVLCRCENEIDPDTQCIKIPCTLKNLNNLKVLDLRNNPLGTFPLQMTELSNLEELHLSNCMLPGIPDELAQLRSLRTLDLSSNLFKTLPIAITQLLNLHILYLSDGQLQSLCGEIKNLVNLERLQLTNNELTSLPEGLFELVNLKKLYLNGNKLTLLNEKVANLVKLEYLVLNQNKLTKIPESIRKLKELRYLNLHENNLHNLPETIADLKQIETLLIDNNPLQIPPVQVCNQGIQSICNYFQAMKNTKEIHAKRLKVVVLGESMAGKTSLVNALIKCESTAIKEDDRTFGVVFFHWKPEPHVDELELMVVDCAGQKKYQMTHQLFLSEGALFILAVDLSRFVFEDEKCYQDNVGQWISLVGARIPRARILLVPTHIDECKNEEEIDLKCRNILTFLKDQRREMINEIEAKSKRFKKTEGRCIPSEELTKILEQHREQKENLPIISLEYKDANDNLYECDELKMKVIPVSNTSLAGTPLLRQELVRIARNKTLSPNIDINLPESWVNIEKEIKNCRKNEGIPCLSNANLRDILNERGIDVNEGELHSCISYLHAIGELHYFKDIFGLEKNVIINPYWLGSVLKQLFRHDMDKNLKYDEGSRKLGVISQQFDQDKRVLLESGVMTEVLLKCIWSEFLGDSETIFPQLLTMLSHFGLACEIPPVGNDLDTPDGSPPAPSYLVPWFFNQNRPRFLCNNWPSQAGHNQIEIIVGFALLRYLPFGLFERFSVLCHKHEPQDYEHWQKGFYMKFNEVLIHSNVYSAKKCETLKVAARAPKNKLDDLWRTLLILLKEVQELLNEWPGINYRKMSFCPVCIRGGTAQPFFFSCDWFKVHKRNVEKIVCRNKIDDTSHEVRMDHLYPSEDVLNGYRNPSVKYSDEIPDCILREELFDVIADSLGTQWTYLARMLGTKHVRVASIKEEKRGNTREQAVEMLQEWKQRLGEEAKLKVIINALRKMKFNEVADSVVRESRRASEHSEQSSEHSEKSR